MSRKDIQGIPDYLAYIVEAIERIHRYVNDLSAGDFLEDEKTQDAVIRNFEILGEAAHNIERYHSVYAEQHPEVPWAVMYAMRNRVSNDAIKIDFELLWQTLHEDLPPLHEQVRRLLESPF